MIIEQFKPEDKINISFDKIEFYALSENTRLKYFLLFKNEEYVEMYSLGSNNIIKISLETLSEQYYYIGTRIYGDNDKISLYSLEKYILPKKFKEIIDHVNMEFRGIKRVNSNLEILIDKNFFGRIHSSKHNDLYFQINEDQVIDMELGKTILNIHELIHDEDLHLVMNGVKHGLEIIHNFKFNKEKCQEIIDSAPYSEIEEYIPEDYFTYNIANGVLSNDYSSINLRDVFRLNYSSSSKGYLLNIFYDSSDSYSVDDISFIEFKAIQKEFNKINSRKEEL